MADHDILSRVQRLVDDEHQLRERLRSGDITTDEEHQRLGELETELDQCWDLLRQRRAKTAAGQDPHDAAVRSGNQVEGYLQ
ncbi:MAG: DUF2630 family protein [Jiangellaceae bacterium]